jgi:hypothetical protein
LEAFQHRLLNLLEIAFYSDCQKFFPIKPEENLRDIF